MSAPPDQLPPDQLPPDQLPPDQVPPDQRLADQRVAYLSAPLLEADLAATPLEQFQRWYADAVAVGLAEPNAMVLATVDAAGAPSTRTVLLKQADARGLVFYTNRSSRKARALASTGVAALTFPWHAMQRQVSVLGVAAEVSREEVREYFDTRPWASRIGAWASRQSAPLASRDVLDERWATLAARWPDRGHPDDVPLPEHWGGYVVRPLEVEFWAGRPSRLHDRLAFLTVADGVPAAMDDASGWRVERRQP